MRIAFTILSLLLSFQVLATPTAEQPDRAVEHYNLENKLGLKGYDPVAYFEDQGGEAIKGDAKIATTYGDVMYRFASEENREIFLEDPTKYEPTYGGWCAWAMANEAYADIDPMIYTQHGDRMHFFISRGAKARFDQQLKSREKSADDYWKSESGEEPRT